MSVEYGGWLVEDVTDDEVKWRDLRQYLVVQGLVAATDEGAPPLDGKTAMQVTPRGRQIWMTLDVARRIEVREITPP